MLNIRKNWDFGRKTNAGKNVTQSGQNFTIYNFPLKFLKCGTSQQSQH